MKHIEEDAELYALGMLDDLEAARVRSHVAECAECRQRVGEAQNVVTQLAAASPQIEPDAVLRSRLFASARTTTTQKVPRMWTAVAAGIAAGVLAASLILVPGRMNQTRLAARNDIAFSTIVRSHFLHVQFAPLEAAAPQAKMLYGRHGEWLYVIVHTPSRHFGVRLVGGDARTVAELTSEGANATLFIADPGQFTAVELTLDGKPVARAIPVLAR